MASVNVESTETKLDLGDINMVIFYVSYLLAMGVIDKSCRLVKLYIVSYFKETTIHIEIKGIFPPNYFIHPLEIIIF